MKRVIDRRRWLRTSCWTCLWSLSLWLCTAGWVLGQQSDAEGKKMPKGDELQLATFGGGCFWCTESVFLKLRGVESVVSGYCGGRLENPSYEQVSSGRTGHAEVIQVKFNPELISYEDLLHVFFATHDPTTLNRQGPDKGTQYRSVIFYHDADQQEVAKKVKAELNKSDEYTRPIVTDIVEFKHFYPAEDYHQDYFNKNPSNPYCVINITPKLQKLQQKFGDKLKQSESGFGQ